MSHGAVRDLVNDSWGRLVKKSLRKARQARARYCRVLQHCPTGRTAAVDATSHRAGPSPKRLMQDSLRNSKEASVTPASSSRDQERLRASPQHSRPEHLLLISLHLRSQDQALDPDFKAGSKDATILRLYIRSLIDRQTRRGRDSIRHSLHQTILRRQTFGSPQTPSSNGASQARVMEASRRLTIQASSHPGHPTRFHDLRRGSCQASRKTHHTLNPVTPTVASTPCLLTS